MRRSKDKFYKRQIFDCLMEGKVVAAGEIAQEVGLSEKSVRNKLDGMNEFLLQKKSSASRGRRCSMYTSCQRISYSCPFKSCVLNSLVFQK